MSTIAINRKSLVSGLLINISAVLLVYFIPTLSHLLNFPLYLIEPMRIMVILAVLHSDRRNAYFLAATLPLFSYAISAHPVFYKMLLISAELLLNVWLFLLLKDRIKNNFAAMATAIVASKVVYYLLKAIFIYFALIESGLFSTPVWIQLLTTAIFSAYAFLVFRSRK